MACNGCSGNGSSTNGCVCKPGRKGDPGPPNTITASVTTLPPGSEAVVVSTGVSPNQHLDFGLPLPMPGMPSATAETGPIGVVVGGTPEAPSYAFTIPSGTNGANGQSRFTTLTASYIQPIYATTVIISVGTTAWMSPGDWIYIQGGGWYVVNSVVSPTGVIIRNPGNPDLVPLWGTPPSTSPWFDQWRIPLNASNGTTVSPVPGALSQVAESGIPGTRGPAGTSGGSPVITVVDTVPTTPPPTEAEAFVIYQNGSGGGTATVNIPYTWDYGSSAWVAGANFAGTPGTRTYFQAADPNVVPIVGSNIGDGNWRVNSGSMTLQQKVSSSSWTTVGSLPFGGATADITHNAAGAEVLDLAFGSFSIDMSKAMELDWSDTNYQGNGNWIVSIENTDGSSLNLTFATSKWEVDPALSLTPPYAIAPGAFVVLKFVKNQRSGKYSITDLYVSTAV